MAACRPGRAEAEGHGRDQQREPAELQGEEELADELLAVGIGRLDRGRDRTRGEDHHLPDLFEHRLGGQECPVDSGSDHLLLRRAAPHARDAPLVARVYGMGQPTVSRMLRSG